MPAAVVPLWRGVQVAIQTALAAAKVLASISKANPAVAGSVAHGYANADYILLPSVEGMVQVSGRPFRVSAAAADVFSLEGENSTAYDTFVSGTAQRITFGASMSTVLGVSPSGGENKIIESTTIHDNDDQSVVGGATAGNYAFESVWDPANAALVELKAASDAQEKRVIRLTFKNGYKVLFNANVGCSMIPGGTTGDKVTTQITLAMVGRPTMYTT